MFDWADYLTLAQELSGRTDQASQRTAISRAYYSAFCTARNYLQKTSMGAAISRTGADHHLVWELLKSGNSQQRRAGENGARLYKSRCKADYENYLPAPPATVTDALLKAQAVIACFPAPKPSP